MSEISKQALLVDNSQSFPNNNAGAITPSDLRAFNVNMIDSLVDEIKYNQDSASWNNSIDVLNQFTASQQPSFSELNAFTASQIITNNALNQFTQSAGQELDSLSAWTGSWEAWTSSINEIRDDGVLQGYSTRFFFNGLVSASIVQNVGGPIANVTIQQDGTKLNTASFNDYTQSQATQQTAYSASVSASLNQLTQFSASQNIINQSVTASLQELLNLSSSLSGGYATQGELDQSASVLQANIDTKTNTSSFNDFTQSQNILNATLATTGSNTFRGIETFEDAAGNATSLVPVSGSLMLVAKGFTSASAHLSASANNQVNLIWKNNNNTADTIISGSNNIFINPTAPTAGFKRYIGGQNIFVGPVIPQISASMQFSPTINSNIGGIYTVRGPVSASLMNLSNNISPNGQFLIGSTVVNHAQGLVGNTSITNNVLGGTLAINANQSNIQSALSIANNNINGTVQLTLSSSAVAFSANTINDTNFILTNQYSSGSIGFGQPTLAANTFGGGGNSIIITGSQQSGTSTLNPSINQNIVIGQLNTLYVNASGSRLNPSNRLDQAIVATSVFGNRLIVSGSSDVADGVTFGSTFIGRNNADDGIRNKSSDIIFAVGTGTSTSTRKTGFLIDTGSNAFVEGSLNVSGSTRITGSVYGNIVALSVSSQTASMDLSLSNFFTLELVSGSTTHLSATNIRQGQTINLLVNQPSVGTGSLSYNSTFDFPAGANYIPTPISSSKDILTFITFDSSTIYATSINNLG